MAARPADLAVCQSNRVRSVGFTGGIAYWGHAIADWTIIVNKAMKATVAAGAAGALLLGGAGTFALWSDQQTIDAGTVETGSLTLSTGAAGTWSDASADAIGGTDFDPATDKLVPGDTVQFEQTVTIAAEGKNLKGALTVGTLGAIPPALVPDVTLTLDTDASAEGLSEDGGVISFAAPGTYQIPVKITVAFAPGTPGSTQETTMNQSIDLGALDLTLNQVR